MPGSSSGALNLPRNRRIKQGRDFARVKANGKRLAHGCLAANWLCKPAGETSRLGVITSKRLGGAVRRNRARRLLREVYRLNQCHLKNPLDLVLIARASIVGKSFRDVQTDFLTVLRRGRLLKA